MQHQKNKSLNDREYEHLSTRNSFASSQVDDVFVRAGENQDTALTEDGDQSQFNMLNCDTRQSLMDEDDVNQEELIEQCKKKCLKFDLFVSVADPEDDEWETLFDSCSLSDLRRIKEANLKTGYRTDDLKDKMDFINRLPLQNKLDWINEIQKKPIKGLNQVDSERLTKFFKEWESSQKASSSSQEESLLYPTLESDDVSQSQQKQQQHEPRVLSMDVEEDVWFVKTIKTVPKPKKGKSYDYMQLNRLLQKSTLKVLEESFIQTSEYLLILKKQITGNTYDVLIELYFQEEESENLQKIHDTIMLLFKDPLAGHTNRKFKDKNLEVFKKLKKIPQAQNAFAKRLIDPNFLKEKNSEWSKILSDPFLFQNMVKMLATFDKATQIVFYKNLAEAVHQCDQLQNQSTFHPELLAMKEKENIREIILNRDKINFKKNFWTTNFPILCYVQNQDKQLVMVHLSDPEAQTEAQRMVFNIEDTHKFISFVETYLDASKNAPITVLLKTDNNSLALRTYTYVNPCEHKDFTDSENNWQIDDHEIDMSEELKKVIIKQRKVSLIDRGEFSKGLLIQTNNSIYFADLSNPTQVTNLIDKDFSVKLEMLRGLNDHFYYALRDDGAASDSLHQLKFIVKGQDIAIQVQNEPIPAAYTGEILAFELDPLNTNDVEQPQQDNDLLAEWQDKQDKIFLIDGRLNLFKLCIERECRTLNKVNLTNFKNIQNLIETQIRDQDFVRVSLTDRCLTYKGRTYNYETGHEWDFIYSQSNMDDEPTDHDFDIQFSQNLPFSHQQIALAKTKYTYQAALLFKNETSSRKLCTFDHRGRDVILFEMINDSFILAKLKGEQENYWTIMDISGNIVKMPQNMKELLNQKEWSKIQSKVIQDEHGGKILIALSRQDPMPDYLKERAKNHARSNSTQISTIFQEYNPYPDVAGILIDSNIKKVLAKQFVLKEVLAQDSDNKTWKALAKKQIYFKTIISDTNEIYLIYADPQKKQNNIEHKKFPSDSNYSQSLPLNVLKLRSTCMDYFKEQDPAIFLGNIIYIKDKENDFLCMKQQEDGKFMLYVDPTKPIRAPAGESILNTCSPFYRCKPAEGYPTGFDDSSDDHELEFPTQIQVCYANKVLVCEVNQLNKMVSETEGYQEFHQGISLLFDPEKYVDTGITLSRLQNEIDDKALDKEVSIWTHIKAQNSNKFYHVCQDWWWSRIGTQQEPRNYSFLGLYRKYSEADIQELIRLKQHIRDHKAIQQVETSALFSNFYGNSIFTIFFKEVKVLKKVLDWLENDNHQIEYDEDNNQLENQDLRRIFYIMAQHEIGRPKYSQLNPNQVNCNSLLYRILYSDNAKCRDLILEIASYCNLFSLQSFFLSLDDVRQILQQPSLQVVKTFDQILVESPYTKQVLTLDFGNDVKLITFWADEFKLSLQKSQEKVSEALQNQDIEPEDRIVNSVTVKMMQIKWLKEGNKNFCDLVEILNDTKNQAIFQTQFVSSLLSGYWDVYFWEIFYTQFVPFICYMFCMVSFLMYALVDGVTETPFYSIIYFPLLGSCILFVVNQVRCEYVQWKTSDTNIEYFSDYWNINDLIYLVLNINVMIMNLFDRQGASLEYQRVCAAISVCFLWLKVFDWLRLFSETAFFIRLITETVKTIRYFLIILIVWYMMFGSSFYLLNMNQDQGNEIVSDMSRLWILDAFQSQYEMSVGEYQTDDYNSSKSQRFLIYLIFFLSTFLIQITFLNMLIAIMGDAFDRATDDRENNARLTKLKIMGDYINVINRNVEDKETNKEQQQSEESISIWDENRKEKPHHKILYVVEPLDENQNYSTSWEGHISSLKRFTEKQIARSESQLTKKMDKVLERVIEAEGRDAVQEREIKTGLQTMMESVKKQIETLTENQKVQYASLKQDQLDKLAEIAEKQDRQHQEVMKLLNLKQNNQ